MCYRNNHCILFSSKFLVYVHTCLQSHYNSKMTPNRVLPPLLRRNEAKTANETNFLGNIFSVFFFLPENSCQKTLQ